MLQRIFLCLLVCAPVFAEQFFTGQGARLVIGQPSFTEQSPESSRRVLGAPGGVAAANNMLFVADANRVSAFPANNRVVIYRNLDAMIPDLRSELPQGGRCPACVGEADVELGAEDYRDFFAPTSSNLRQPTAVASDGQVLVVADTENNRVLIWNSIPTQDHAAANVVLGQPDFSSNVVNAGTGDPRVPNASSLKGPQGVWIQNGRLYVADTGNHRVLIWNSIPTSNNAPANVVLGQTAFDKTIGPSIIDPALNATVSNLLNPVSVSSDGTRLFVADLGHNRVMVWNSIPTQTNQAADIALGQPDMESGAANNSPELCDPLPDDENPFTPEPRFPFLCAATLSFPRFVLAAEGRLFVADGGNDRIQVWNQIPTRSGQPADVILGQISDSANLSSDSGNPLGRSSAATLRTPMSLAWDGKNLFVADPFNRRVVVFTPADEQLLYTAARNAASREVHAIGAVTLQGNIQKDDEILITVGAVDYKYKVKDGDDLDDLTEGLVQAVNAGQGDPLVLASRVRGLPIVLVTAREPGVFGDAIDLAAGVSPTAQIQVQASGATLSGGGDATQIAPGTLLSIIGDDLASGTASADLSQERLPLELARTRVYIDGIAAPLLYVSPRQINTQVPWELRDANSGNLYVRTVRPDGRVEVTNPVALPVVRQNPGIFARDGIDPRPAIALHYSSAATGTISVDGTVTAGEQAIVKINEREYTYTTAAGDTLATVRDNLVEQIAENDPEVTAFASGIFTRIRLRARVDGPAGNGIPITAESRKTSGTGEATLLMTALNETLCCANEAGAPVTEANPAIPGETIVVFATGLGLVDPEEAEDALITGVKYTGPELNAPEEFVSALIAGRTANVLFAGIQKGSHDLYEVHLELGSGAETNLDSQLTIAQGFFVSNIVTLPVVNPSNPNQGRLSSSPGGGRGTQQVFNLRYTRPSDGPVLGTFGVLFNNSLEPNNSCYVIFNVNNNQIQVWNSTASSFGNPVTAGSEATAEGSHCNVNALNSKVTLSQEGQVEAALDITFKDTSRGSRSFFINGWDTSGEELGWQTLGVWTVP